MKKLNFTIAILFCMMMCFSSVIFGQVPSGYTIVKAHNDDITWYEVKSSDGYVSVVYNNEVLFGDVSSVTYSHGYFFKRPTGGYDWYYVYDKQGNKVEPGGNSCIKSYEVINEELYMFYYDGIYDEYCRKIADSRDALVKIGNNAYLKTKENGKYGFKDLSNDRQLLANKYDEISKLGETDYYKIKENGKYGLYDFVNDKIVLSPLYAYFFELLSGSNGETFIKAGLDYSHKGIYDISGEEILAPEFDDCGYMGGNLFKFKMNGYWGVMNRQGKIIIPLSRQYTQIDYSRTLKTFTFAKEGGYKGECNANGTQTFIAKVQQPKPQQQAQQPKQETKTQITKQETVTPTPQPQPQPQPEPQPRQLQPFQVWQACFLCGGSGQCPYCYGFGWAANGKDACGVCHGTGKCSQCAGHGGQNVIEYH